MRTIALAFLALLLSTSLPAADLVNVAGASHIAIDGYDPVAFFTDSKPVNGSPFISVTHPKAVYFFATEEHKRLFTQNPNKYVPQYGGFCAFGVGLDALFRSKSQRGRFVTTSSI